MNSLKNKIMGMKNWDDETQRWIGIVCQVDEDNVAITVLDVMFAETQVEIDNKLKESITTKPWTRGGDEIVED